MSVQEGSFTPATSGDTPDAAKSEAKIHSFKVGSSRSPEVTRNRRGETEPTPNKEKPLIEEVRADFKEYLRGHMQRMLRLHETLTPAQFDALTGPNGEHMYDRELFNELTKQEKEGSASKKREIDNTMFDKFMGTNKGMGIAYALRRAQFNLEATAEGAVIDIDPSVGPAGTLGSERIPLEGAGAVRKMMEAGRRFLGRPVRQAHGRPHPDYGSRTIQDSIARAARQLGTTGMVGAGLATLIAAVENNSRALTADSLQAGLHNGNLPGLIAGISVGAIYGLIRRSNREGSTLDVVECVQALQNIAGDPVPPGTPGAAVNRQPNYAEVQWLKEFSAYDPFDLEVYDNNGTPAVRVKPGRTPESLFDRQSRRDSLVGHATALLAFQEANGVPEGQRTTGDASWVFGDANRAQTGLDIDQRANRILNPNREGIRDVNGNTYEILVGGRWETNINYDPTNLDVHGNEERKRAAYRQALVAEIQAAFTEIRDADPANNPRATLDTELSAKESQSGRNSPAFQARMRELNTLVGEAADGKGGLLGQDRAKLAEIATTLDGFREAEQKITDATRARDRLVARVQKALVPVTAATLKREINDTLRPAVTPGSIVIDGEDIGNIHNRQQQFDTEIETQLQNGWRNRNAAPTAPSRPTPSPGGTPEVEAANARMQAAYQEQLTTYRAELAEYRTEEKAARQALLEQPGNKSQQDAIDNDAKKLNSILTDFQKAETTIKTEREKLRSRNPDNDTRNNMLEALSDMDRARGEIENNAAVPLNLSPNNYRTDTFNVLMANINAGNTNDVNFGWPEAENGNAENRNMLINAMVEARITAPTPEFAQAIDVNIWAIPEYDLLAMDTAGIRTLMQDRLAALPAGATVPSDAQIDALRNQARGRQTERVAALTQIDTERTTEQRTQARERDRLNRENQDNQIAPELKAARKIFDRFGSINRDIETVDITHLLNVGNVDRTADPNDANIYPEYADGESRAYLQMMDLMFAHSGEADAVYQNNRGPQAAYLRNQELMSQDRLHVLLRNHFGLGSANFNQSVNELQQRFLRGALSRAQLGYFFSEIVIYGQQVGPRIDGGLVKQRIHAL